MLINTLNIAPNRKITVNLNAITPNIYAMIKQMLRHYILIGSGSYGILIPPLEPRASELS